MVSRNSLLETEEEQLRQQIQCMANAVRNKDTQVVIKNFDRTDGSFTDIWVRSTTCFKRQQSGWKIIHEHTSVPFYMDGSQKAAVDLKPNKLTNKNRFERK